MHACHMRRRRRIRFSGKSICVDIQHTRMLGGGHMCVCHMRRRIHVCHMRKRVHVCHMRRRIHACVSNEEEDPCAYELR